METKQKAARGRLRIYLGYAAGVGKTYAMLSDAHREREKGTDLVIGYVEPHARRDTIEKALGIETVPRKKIEYRGKNFEEMDPQAVIERRPKVCLIDELAHTNVPGSGKTKRWEDVLEVLATGIDVWTTLNVQHLEGLNDEVESLTGIRVRETLPDWVFETADEVLVVDLTTEALVNRLRRGVVYPPERAAEALRNFFREGNLAALRELTLRQAAHQVETKAAETGVVEPGLSTASSVPASMPADASRRKERIAVLLTANPATASVIRRAARMAGYFHGDCVALFVTASGRLTELKETDRLAVERHLRFARNLRIETRIIQGTDPAKAVVEFARRNQIGEIYVHRYHYHLWQRILGRNLVHRMVNLAPDLRVIVAAT